MNRFIIQCYDIPLQQDSLDDHEQLLNCFVFQMLAAIVPGLLPSVHVPKLLTTASFLFFLFSSPCSYLLSTLAHYIRAHYAFENYSNMLVHQIACHFQSQIAPCASCIKYHEFGTMFWSMELGYIKLDRSNKPTWNWNRFRLKKKGSNLVCSG